MKDIHIKVSTGEDLVSVNVDGFCNHASTKAEMVSFDTPSQVGEDTTERYLEETCTRCGAYRRVDESGFNDFEWQGGEDQFDQTMKLIREANKYFLDLQEGK